MHKFLVALLLLACEGNAITTSSTANPDYKVGLLFEHDGCKVYRFTDGTMSHYFVKCKDGNASTVSTKSDSDDQTWSETIPTKRR